MENNSIAILFKTNPMFAYLRKVFAVCPCKHASLKLDFIVTFQALLCSPCTAVLQPALPPTYTLLYCCSSCTFYIRLGFHLHFCNYPENACTTTPQHTNQSSFETFMHCAYWSYKSVVISIIWIRLIRKLWFCRAHQEGALWWSM